MDIPQHPLPGFIPPARSRQVRGFGRLSNHGFEGAAGGAVLAGSMGVSKADFPSRWEPHLEETQSY